MRAAVRTLEELLNAPEARALAVAAREALEAWLPNVEETVDSSAPVIGYGYGAGSRAVVYTLILSKTGVKLGLARGSELDDPQGLLEGKGKVHRYISLRAPADLRAPGVRRLVQGAYSAWKQRK
jgi:hypothetical protein